MRIGADTGLFLYLAQGHPRAEAVWGEIVAGQHELVLSVVNVHEVWHYFHRIGKVNAGLEWLDLLQTFPNIKIETVSLEIATKSAGYRFGLGLATIDAIILTTFVIAQCELVMTADADFEIVMAQKVIPVEVLR